MLRLATFKIPPPPASHTWLTIHSFLSLCVQLTDYGLSKLLKDGEFARTVCGTPDYVAPEVVDYKPYSVS